jgi:hypothetical protein
MVSSSRQCATPSRRCWRRISLRPVRMMKSGTNRHGIEAILHGLDDEQHFRIRAMRFQRNSFGMR